jgi:hypothetical protein
LPTPIVIRNNTTWLSQEYLLQKLTGISDSCIKAARSKYKATVAPSFHGRDVLPDTGKAWRWAKLNDTFYYAYNNIPDKAPACYRSQLPPEKDLTTQQYGRNAFAPSTTHHSDLTTHLTTAISNNHYTYLPLYTNCTKDQQTNLAKAAALLDAAIEYIHTHSINTSKQTFFNQVAAFVAANDIKYFPKHPRVIKRKIEPFLSGGEATPEVCTVIHLPRSGNDNASKGFDEPEIRSWVLQLRDMGANYTNLHIIRKIYNMCELTGKPQPSERWIGSIMEEHNTRYLTAQQRFGDKSRFGAIHRSYVPLQNALFAGDCWQVDGSRVNLIEHKNADGKAFLYIVAVRDVHSGDILGYNFSITEDRWAVHNALKMAAKNAGYLPYELVCDKFPGHNAPEMITFFTNLRNSGTKVTISSDPNVKPSMERWFGTLQTAFMQDSPFYYGQGIRSRRNYAHRSPEFIKRMRQQAAKLKFDWDKACEKPHTIALAPEDYYYLFTTQIELPVDGAGLIKKTIQGTDFYFRTTDYSIFSKHNRVLVCYDLENLSEVMLYSITDGPIKQFLGRATEETPAQRYGPDAEWDKINKRKAIIKEMDNYRTQELEYRKEATNNAIDIPTLLAPLSAPKHQYENIETQYLLPTHTHTHNHTQTHTHTDDEDFTFNPLSQL